jgi:hypothetical protein
VGSENAAKAESESVSAPPASERQHAKQRSRQQILQWLILAIAIAIPLVVGGRALLRLRAPSDLMSGVGNGLVVLLCAVVLLLFAAIFAIAWLCRRCRREGAASARTAAKASGAESL